MTDLPNFYPLLVNDPRGGLRELGEYLARTGRWFAFKRKPAVLADGVLTVMDSIATTEALIASDDIPLRNVHGSSPPFKNVRKEGLPALIHGHFAQKAHAYFPEITRVVRLPSVRASMACGHELDENGNQLPGLSDTCIMQAQPGYDAVSKVVYLGDSFEPLCPPNEDFPCLKEWLSGLLFDSDYHHANALGIMAAILCRPVLERFPIILVEANTHSAGKTTLAQAMGYVLTGELPESLSYTGTEENFERNLSNYANKPGPNFILVDNVRKKANNASIRSMTLARSITGHTLGFRALYKGNVGLFDPIFVFTMNAASVEQDLGDKVVSIRLKRPESTAHKKLDPNPLDYAVDHRQELLAELYQLLECMPLTKDEASFTRFYEFEAIVAKAAERLGMKASFDPSLIPTTSAIVQEMVYLVEYTDKYEFGKPFSLQAAADTIQAKIAEYKELGATLVASNIPSKGRGKMLAQLLLFSINDMVFNLPGDKKYHFKIEGEEATITERS